MSEARIHTGGFVSVDTGRLQGILDNAFKHDVPSYGPMGSIVLAPNRTGDAGTYDKLIAAEQPINKRAVDEKDLEPILTEDNQSVEDLGGRFVMTPIVEDIPARLANDALIAGNNPASQLTAGDVMGEGGFEKALPTLTLKDLTPEDYVRIAESFQKSTSMPELRDISDQVVQPAEVAEFVKSFELREGMYARDAEGIVFGPLMKNGLYFRVVGSFSRFWRADGTKTSTIKERALVSEVFVYDQEIEILDDDAHLVTEDEVLDYLDYAEEELFDALLDHANGELEEITEGCGENIAFKTAEEREHFIGCQAVVAFLERKGDEFADTRVEVRAELDRDATRKRLIDKFVSSPLFFDATVEQLRTLADMALDAVEGSN